MSVEGLKWQADYFARTAKDLKKERDKLYWQMSEIDRDGAAHLTNNLGVAIREIEEVAHLIKEGLKK